MVLVDDMGFSIQLVVCGAPIWPNADGACRAKGHTPELKDASPRQLVHEGHGRIAANLACLDCFHEQHAIWGG